MASEQIPGGHVDRHPAECPAGAAAYWSLSEVLRRGAKLLLDIDPQELAAGLQPISDGSMAVFLADTLDNGAGYANDLGDKQRFAELLHSVRHDLAREYGRASHSHCDTSCPDCLRSYDNRRLHGALDWRLALDMLDLAAGEPLDDARWVSRGAAIAGGLASTPTMDLVSGQLDNGVSYVGSADRTRAVLLGHPLWRSNLDHAVEAQALALDDSRERARLPAGAPGRRLHRHAAAPGGAQVPSVDDVEVAPTAPRSREAVTLRHQRATRLPPQAGSRARPQQQHLAPTHTREPRSAWSRTHSPRPPPPRRARTDPGPSRMARGQVGLADRRAEGSPCRGLAQSRGPAPAAWPGYAITKVRLIRRLTEKPPPAQVHPVATDGAFRSRAHGNAALRGRRHLCHGLSGRLHAGHLFGTPDLVEEVDGELRVVDLKAGVHQGRRHPTSDASSSSTPVSCTTRSRGSLTLASSATSAATKTSFGVTSPEVDEAIADAESARESFNEAITTTAGAPARPASETCGWCDFRVVCSAYWRSRQPDWPSVNNDLIGEVTEASHPYAQLRLIDTDEPSRVVLAEAGVEAHVGDLLVVTDVARAGFQTSRPRWNSHVRVIRNKP